MHYLKNFCYRNNLVLDILYRHLSIYGDFVLTSNCLDYLSLDCWIDVIPTFFSIRNEEEMDKVVFSLI